MIPPSRLGFTTAWQILDQLVEQLTSDCYFI